MANFWPFKETNFEQNPIAEYHPRNPDSRKLYGPVDKQLPESTAILQLFLMQPGGLTLAERSEFEEFRPKVFGEVFVPTIMVPTKRHKHFPDMLVAGNVQVPETEITKGYDVLYVQLDYLFVTSSIQRAVADKRGQELPVTVRTRIYETSTS